MLPEPDKVGQIQRLTEFLRVELRRAPPRHVAGRAGVGAAAARARWPRPASSTSLVDDQHFALAGLDPGDARRLLPHRGRGRGPGVFPISQRLRYLVPFADPRASLEYLESRRGAGSVTLVDDGEKFGVWPGTHRLVYKEGWLRRFFDALRRARPGWRCPRSRGCLDSAAGRGGAYTCPPRPTRRWASGRCPPPAAAELEEARSAAAGLPDGARLGRLLRGGFWRGFLVKYPEVGDAYWRMLRLSRRLRGRARRAPGDRALLEARERLWRGQANDAYWHGVFGGCYLPHLRRGRAYRAARGRGSLVARAPCPRRLTERGRDNGDGRAEVRRPKPPSWR